MMAVAALTGAAPAASPDPDRRRGHVPEPDLHQVVRRLQQEDRRPDQLPVDRLRRRHPPVHRGDGGLRRHRRPDERVADRGGQRATCSTSRPCSAPSSSPTTCPRSATPSSSSTATTLVDIFMGRITKWNDKRIAALNPGVKLPDIDIIVVHRSDGSGTTYVFTDYLNKFSREWKDKVGYATSVNWPVGLGGKGNEGVTQQVKQTEGAIGYVELIYALSNKLPLRRDQERRGQLRRALARRRSRPRPRAPSSPKDTDFRVSITNAPGAAPTRSRRSPGCWSRRTRRIRPRPSCSRTS